MWPKPITRIHQIEPTSECNLKCSYCPHPKMTRDKTFMSMETFERTLEWVKYYMKHGTQTELSLTGLGEPLMHPEFVTLVKKVREFFNGKLLFATNGKLLNEDMAKALAPYEIEAWISTHSVKHAIKARDIGLKAGMLIGLNSGFISASIDWAGQVDHLVTAPSHDCQYLAQGWGTVLQDGSITTCCMDAEGDGIVGHVNDDIGSLSLSPYKLCKTCSLKVPVMEKIVNA